MIENNKLNLNDFPTTRYQGSKRKILPWLYDIFSELDFETVLDAFGGTASVSYLLKRMNKFVTYNDSLQFNYLIGKAIIENKEVRLDIEDISDLTTKMDNREYFSIVSENFNNIYYLDEENEWIDLVMSNIMHLSQNSTSNSDYKEAIAYYALFQACLIKRPFNLFHRKNLYLRTNKVKRTFGNKQTWDRSFETYFLQFLSEANRLVFDNGLLCESMNKSAFDIEKTDFDLVYIDPPYIRGKGNNETSYYFNCYHFLEGLTRYIEWPRNIDHSVKNRRLIQKIEPKYFNNENVEASLSSLMEKFRNSIIVLSYKVGGYPNIDKLRRIMKKFKKKVYIHEKRYTYALNKQNGNGKLNREVVIIGM